MMGFFVIIMYLLTGVIVVVSIDEKIDTLTSFIAAIILWPIYLIENL